MHGRAYSIAVDRMLYAVVEAAVGPIARAQPCTRGTTARVWCIDAAHGRFAVKVHARGRAFEQERTALVRLAGAADDPWPQLVASDRDRLAIVTTWLPGTRADDPAIDPRTRARVFAAAGALRRRFDALPCDDDDPLPLPDALERRMAAALASLDRDVVARVQTNWRPHVFASATRRFCHRDFAPHNWLVADGGLRLRVIDFGHARADHPLVDLARALSPVWGAPAQRSALLTGYGRALAPAALAELRQLELLDAVATAAWGRRRGDTALAHGGHAAISAWLTEAQ